MSNTEELLKALPQNAIKNELAKRSLHEFVKQAWEVIEPGRVFHDNWHIQAICEHLEAVHRGEITRLIINIPPRHMKSITTCVGFPTWVWLQKPHTQFMFASYAASLSVRDSVKCRRLMQSPWYQQLKPPFKMDEDQNQKARYSNDHNGHRLSTSTTGSLIGEGGDIIVIDDPHNTMEVESAITRNSVLDWWDHAVQSRLNDPTTGAFIVIMQRLHQQDLTGHILANQDPENPWTHLCIPAEYEHKHPTPFFTTIPNASVTSDPRNAEGELLWKARFPEKALNHLKTSLGSYASAGQLQQRPSPKGGGILKESWWRCWESPTVPDFVYVIQSWDTAFSERDNASYSACTTWGVFIHGSRYHVMLMDHYRKRVPYYTLRRDAKDLHDEWKPDVVLIEKKASGQSLIQDLKQMGLMVIAYSPDRDKVSRAHSASPLLESGLVWHPDRMWAQEVIQHCALFPAGTGTDTVDTVTQALIRLRTMWYAIPEDDDHELEDIPEREDPFRANVIPIRQGAIYG